MIKIFESCHVFYDHVAEYMDRLSNQDNELRVCNNEMDHLEETKDPEGDISSCFSNSEGQEEYISPVSLEEEGDSKWDTSLCFINSKINFPYSIQEHNPILFETLIRN